MSTSTDETLPNNELTIGINKLGTAAMLIAPLACLLWGVFSTPQTSLDEITRWCFIGGGAILTLGALYIIIFPPAVLHSHMDSEGFRFKGEKVPWQDVLSITKHEFRLRKNSRFLSISS